MTLEQTLPLWEDAAGTDSYTPEWASLTARSLPQAFPYQGSKRALAREILSLFPENTATLWEPFAGSAAISIAAMKYQVASSAVVSDVNAPLINLWDCIINDPEGIASEYATHWYNQQDDPRAYYLEARDKFNASGDPGLLLYLLCRCVKAAVRYNKRTGDFNQGADHRRLGVRPKALQQRISEASAIMQGVTTKVGSYEGYLLGASKDDLVYMDPPYQGTSDVPDHRYLAGLTRNEFVDVLAKANDNKVSYVLSYDAHTDDDKYGKPLDAELGLTHLNVRAGVSSQGTLSGRSIISYESLYVSPAATERLGGESEIHRRLRALGQSELAK